MNTEQNAFARAYENHVGDASPEIVEAFLTTEGEVFYRRFPEYYSGLADAYGVWLDALIYAKRQQLEELLK